MLAIITVRNVLVLLSANTVCYAINCGFPGRPAYGRALQVADSYTEGQTVSYTCDNGYYMVGPVIRRCLPNGTWTGNIPVCDTTLSPAIDTTTSSEALSLYPPELAVDGNKRTCFYTNKQKPRWWRMNMGGEQTVISVSITVPLASSEHHFTIYVIEINDTITKYHKCASFRGVFSSQAMILVCGNGKGFTGQMLFIEDNNPKMDHFGLCEIEIFVHKDYYECGQPEVPTNSYTLDHMNDNNHGVQYSCMDGYKMEGSNFRSCQRNGQWSGRQPICREVTCPKPEPIKNGFYTMVGHINGRANLGSKIVYECKTGFNIDGNETMHCLENGSWTGSQPKCEAVDCGHPSIDGNEHLGGKFNLLNGSTGYQSMAELVCFEGNNSGLTIFCKEDGTWTKLDATCIYSKANFIYDEEVNEYRILSNSQSNKIALILFFATICVVLSLFLLIMIVCRKKILQFKWSTEPVNNSLGRRSSWALDALRATNIEFKRPFRCHPRQSKNVLSPVTESNASVKSQKSQNSNKFENIYEEIVSSASLSTLSDDTEEKMRKAAMIAAEVSAINEKKHILSNPLSKACNQLPQTNGLYAEVDFALKRRQRLERERLEREQRFTKECALRKAHSNPGALNDLSAHYELNGGNQIPESSYAYLPRREAIIIPPRIYPRNHYLVSDSPSSGYSANDQVFSIS